MPAPSLFERTLVYFLSVKIFLHVLRKQILECPDCRSKEDPCDWQHYTIDEYTDLKTQDSVFQHEFHSNVNETLCNGIL